MVMVTRSASRKATQSLNSSDISQQNIIRVPPWCSSGKVYERRKPRKASPAWEMESSYPLRENIWDYLNDKSGHFHDSRRMHVKKIKQKNRVHKMHKVVILAACLLIVFGLSVAFLSLWVPERIPKLELIKSLLPEVKLLRFVNLHTTSANEECCYKLRHLTLTLSQIEHELSVKIVGAFMRRPTSLVPRSSNVSETNLKQGYVTLNIRNMLRLRRKFMLSLPNTRTSPDPTTSHHFPKETLILGAKAIKGSSTKEWSTQVALWGVVPLWRSAPHPDTILALRESKPSDCWPFSGSYGEVIIELPRTMPVRGLSLEHIRPDTTRSAPKNFMVYGILQNSTHIKVADGTYSYKKPAKQYYALNENVFTKSIILRILSNQGNQKYTCVYRVQVYGLVENTFLV